MPKERLLQCQADDRARGLSEHHIQQLKAYFTQCEQQRPAAAQGSSWGCAGAARAATS